MDEHDETTFRGIERLALLLVGLVLVIVTGIVVVRVSSPGSGTIGSPDDRPTPDPEIDLPISVDDALALASSWAKEWNEEARLVLVSSQFELFGEEPPETPSADGGLIIFSFVAPKQGDEWPRASVAVSRETGAIVFDEVTSSAAEPPEPLSFSIGGLPISAEQAFRIAEYVVGRSYREGCEPSRRQVTVDLDATDLGNPTWVVVYYDQRERHINDIVVRINAQSGELDTEVRGDVTCDAA